jgi:hypothetical protein
MLQKGHFYHSSYSPGSYSSSDMSSVNSLFWGLHLTCYNIIIKEHTFLNW